jgi:rod shape-determining protein MreC
LALRYKSLIVLVVVLFGQMLLMAWQLRRDQDVPLVRNTVVYIVSPIQRGLNAVTRSIRGVWEGYIGLRGAHRENEALTHELNELKMESHRLRERAEQGRRLQVLFDLREQVALPMVAAQVLSVGSSETARLVMIDKGADHGLRPDLPVIVPDGVVGKVLHVFAGTAQVQLITDSYSGVAGLLENSRSHGVVKGQNQAVCALGYLPNGEDVQPGQLVLTSGEDQIYPKGLPVGVVVEAKPGPEFQQITVQPLAPLNRLEEVLVILQSGGEVTAFPVTSNRVKQPEQVQTAAPATPAIPATPAVAATAGATAPTSSPSAAAAPQGPPVAAPSTQVAAPGTSVRPTSPAPTTSQAPAPPPAVPPPAQEVQETVAEQPPATPPPPSQPAEQLAAPLPAQ